MPNNSPFKILLLFFILLLIAIPVSFYIIRQTFLQPQPTSSQQESTEEEIIINSPQDLAEAIKKVSPHFTDPQLATELLLKLIDEAENYQPSATLSAKLAEFESNIDPQKAFKQSRYSSIFSILIAQYYATRSKQILLLAQAVAKFYQTSFPEDYQPEEWQIEAF